MNKLNIVMYHYIRDLEGSRYPEIKGLDMKIFKKQISFFKYYYNFVTIEDILEAYDSVKNLPPNALLLTFDDGYMDHYNNAFPILQDNHIQGVFNIPGKAFTEHVLLDVNKIHFILACADFNDLYKDLVVRLESYVTEYNLPDVEELICKYAVADRFDDAKVVFIKRILQIVLPEELRNIICHELFLKYVNLPEDKFAKELYMNYDQIKCMKQNGMHIGLHGYDHYWLANMPKEKMQRDIDSALDAMDGLIDKNSWIFNYPYGSYNDEVIQYASSKGCQLGMTTKVERGDLMRDSRYELPRLDTNDFPPKSENYKKYEL